MDAGHKPWSVDQVPTTQSLKVMRVIGVLAGLLLFAIGVRFLIVPDQATRTFGLAKDLSGNELSYIIGLRDLWLGALAIAFALLREWRALALWFAFGVLVCWSDALIAASSGGRFWPVVFHAVCGVACAILAVAVWRADRGEKTAYGRSP